MTKNKLTNEEYQFCHEQLNDAFSKIRTYLQRNYEIGYYHNFEDDKTKMNEELLMENNFSDALVAMNGIHSLSLEALKYAATGWCSSPYVSEKMKTIGDNLPNEN